MSKGPLFDRSMDFAVRMVNFAKYLRKKKEATIAKQVLRSGTAVGALIREANHA